MGYLGGVLVKVSIAGKRHHDHSKSYKENISLGWPAYTFRGSGHGSHDREHGGVQAGVVLEEQRESYILGRAGSRLPVTLSKG